MGWMFDMIGHLIARLQGPAEASEPFTPDDPTGLRDALRPGDVLLVDGKGRISGSIKYLTQSSWSHSALYVGPIAGAATDGEPHVLIEANLGEGVVSAPLSKYLPRKTRICRPVGLSEADCEKVCRYARERVGLTYDFKNAFDLMRVSVAVADDAEQAMPNDRARLRRCQPHDLLVADRASLRRRALSDPSQDHAR